MSNEDIESTSPPPVEMPTYWQAMSGFNYQSRVADRQAGGQPTSAHQEAFRHEPALAVREHLGRPIDLLEFGCGFGRHSWYLSSLAGIRYHGYDFSEQMVAPLRKVAPPGLTPLDQHLFVGPDVVGAVQGRKFDLIVSVSVLIHNPPDRIHGLIAQLNQVLKSDGVLCLVENQVVPFSVFENNWHEGCWLHRYLDAVGPEWDVRLAHGQIDTHDVYVLCHNDRGARRCFQINSASEALEGGVPLAEDEVDRLGLTKLKSWARKSGDRAARRQCPAARPNLG